MTAPVNEPSLAATAPAARRSNLLLAPAMIASLGLGILAPAIVSSQLMLTLMTQAVIGAVLATGVGFLMRQNGVASFGHAAFFGLAAYIVALNGKFGLMPTEAAILVAVVVPAVLAFVAGLGIVRLPALAFSMLTLAVAQALHEIFLRWRELASGDDGMAVRLPSTLFGLDIAVFQRPASMFVVSWSVLVLIIGLLWLIARSHFGLLTIAIRENEERARYIGHETVLPRALTYSLSAAVAALGGVLFVLYNAFVTPETLDWSLSGEGLIMAVIGGARVIWGPALGAIIFFIFKDAAGDFTEHWQAIIGMTFILVTVWAPNGVSGLLFHLVSKLKARAR